MDAYDVQSESTDQSTNYPSTKLTSKPVMIYQFIDPFCYNCWTIEAIFKRLTMKYGVFFNVRPIISHLFNGSDSCSNNRYPIDQLNYYHLSVGIKAAGLQGNKAGRDFLKNVREIILLDEQVDSSKHILLQAAKQTQLDVDEFQNDLDSFAAKKAYQKDTQLIQEMNIDQFPTIVFFSQYIEDYSVKIAGLHSFDTYAYLLKKMLQTNTNTKQICVPSLEVFLANYKRVQAEDVAFTFNLPIDNAIKELKRLQLSQKVKKVEMNGRHFWEYQD